MNKKLMPESMFDRLREGEVLLAPLVVRSCSVPDGRDKVPDARIDVSLPQETNVYRFVVESNLRSTPEVVRNAMYQAKSAQQPGEWPLIQVPFLSPDRIEELERGGVSGVDMCGNGIVVVPDRLYVMRTGAPNRYPDTRPLNNPYRGRSAMVARMLLTRPRWESLSELADATEAAGCKVSMAQTSKTVQALKEDMIVSKSKTAITLSNPLSLLDRLGSEWRQLVSPRRQFLRLPPNSEWARALESNPQLQWSLTGEASVKRYTMFAQSGPRRIAVSNLSLALPLVGGVPEKVPNFADVELVETNEPGYYMGNEIAEDGVRWANKLQTWIELQAGDGRQRDAAGDLREQLLREVKQ